MHRKSVFSCKLKHICFKLCYIFVKLQVGLTWGGVGPQALAGGGALRSATGRVNEVRGRTLAPASAGWGPPRLLR